jgi:hypothetical protein
MTATDTQRLDGLRVWLVSDGSARSTAWHEPLSRALRARGAASVDSFGTGGAIEQTARELIGAGAERIARTLRFVRRGQPDISAFELASGARPDIVLVDHAPAMRVLDLLRDATRTGALHVGLVTHFGGAWEWAQLPADAFIVPDVASARLLRSPPRRDEAVVVAGPPVPAGFAESPDIGALRKEFGFGETLALLVDASEMTPATADAVVAALADGAERQLLFHHGDNRAVADALRLAASTYGVRARMFGAIEDLHRVVHAVDAVVLGPASTRVGAVLAANTPVVSLDLGLGPAAATLDGALRVTGSAALRGVLAALDAPEERRAWVEAATRAIAQDPCDDVAAAVADLWGARDALKASPTDRAGARDTGDVGRFEEIGSGSPAHAAPPITRDAARERLAALILDERRVEADISAFATERDKWLERLSLAEKGGDRELTTFADGYVRDLTARIAGLNEQMAVLQRQKDAVRRSVATAPRSPAPTPATSTTPSTAPALGSPDDLEARFRKLERDRELERLRDRALGDE